jgi:hypothetical protein
MRFACSYVIVLSLQKLYHIGLCGTSYRAIWNISENSYIFFITEMHTSDGHDNRPVTRKLHVVGPLINTSDVQICPACHCNTYTSDGQIACH